MEFERKLRERLYQQELKQIERSFEVRWKDELSRNEFKDVKFRIENAYSIYLSNTAKEKTKEKLYELYGAFEQAMEEDVLVAMKEDIELDEREKTYIMYSELEEYGRRGKSN